MDNGAGVPPYSIQHWQGPNPKWNKKGRENNLNWESSQT
jgi:hypothetical protein